jgi:hypothetical protein
MSARNHSVALAESQNNVVNTANLSGALDDRAENRLHVRGRAADDTEHFRRRGLMFQSFAQFGIAFLQFSEQPDILDRDDSLRGKNFKQLYVPFRKWPDFLSPNNDYADRNSFAK